MQIIPPDLQMRNHTAGVSKLGREGGCENVRDRK